MADSGADDVGEEIRVRIVDAIVERLEAIPGVGVVEDMPSGDVDENRLPALAVYDLGQRRNAGADSYPVSGYVLRLSIEGYVPGGEGARTRRRLSRLYGEVIRALMADPQLEGIAQKIEEGDLDFDISRLSAANGMGFVLGIGVTYLSRRDDPSVI